MTGTKKKSNFGKNGIVPPHVDLEEPIIKNLV